MNKDTKSSLSSSEEIIRKIREENKKKESTKSNQPIVVATSCRRIDLITLGFDILHLDKKGYKLTFPKGWSFYDGSSPFATAILDEKKHKRGLVYNASGDFSMVLRTRYFVNSEVDKSKEGFRKVYAKDRQEGRILFKLSGNYLREEELKARARTFLNANFPEWEDPTKYWD